MYVWKVSLLKTEFSKQILGMWYEIEIIMCKIKKKKKGNNEVTSRSVITTKIFFIYHLLLTSKTVNKQMKLKIYEKYIFKGRSGDIQIM